MDIFCNIFMLVMLGITVTIGILCLIATSKVHIEAEKARQTAKKTGDWEEADALNRGTMALAFLSLFVMTLPILVGLIVTRLLVPAIADMISTIVSI